MATESTQEWENAVVGTILGSSLGAVALGGFQLANGEMSGLISLAVGVCGITFIGFHPEWSDQRAMGKERLREYLISSDSDPISVLSDQYARGEIDDVEFDRRLRRLRTADWYNPNDTTTPTDEREESEDPSESEPIPTRN